MKPYEPIVLLSASVPLADRDPRYRATADVVAIREAVWALANVVAPVGTLVWGGHPAITPIIALVARSLGVKVQDHLVVYQSAYFRSRFPPENGDFDDVIVVPEVAGDLHRSVEAMRQAMITAFPYEAGVFIGGMEGVLDEFRMMRTQHANATLLPVASTGAAAKVVFDREGTFPQDLETDLNYTALFRRHLGL